MCSELGCFDLLDDGKNMWKLCTAAATGEERDKTTGEGSPDEFTRGDGIRLAGHVIFEAEIGVDFFEDLREEDNGAERARECEAGADEGAERDLEEGSAEADEGVT